jgi:lipoate-protein ligase A
VNKFRLIMDPALSGSINMAKDHAILHGIAYEGMLPSLRIYRWIEPTVTVGYFEDVDSTVNRSYCKKKKIPIIRRESGGGTVLHHMELTYSLTIPLGSNLIPQSVDESFKKIISPVMNTLKEIIGGVEYKPVNDIIINKRKISGSAQIRKYGVIQQHGTIIMDIDDEILTSSIFYDEYKLNSRGFTLPRQSLTSLKDETGKDINEKFIEEFATSIINRFAKEFNIEFIDSDITEPEDTVMQEYVRKFASNEWNFREK